MDNKLLKARDVAVAVLFTAAIAALAAVFTDTSSDWYKSLTLPAFQPPPLVFTIVWTALYLAFAFSFSLHVLHGCEKRTVWLYTLNGVLNPLWTYVFFDRHNLFGALFLLIAMLYLSIRLYKKVYESNLTAAYLLLPYVVWLAFALYLNYEIAFLN